MTADGSMQSQPLDLATTRLAALVFEQSSEGMVICDATGAIVTANRTYCAMTGYELGELIGQNPRILASGRHDRRFYETMWSALGEVGDWQGEIWNRRKTGEIYPEWLSLRRARSGDGEPWHYIGICSDISHQKATEAYIRTLAFNDALTGLANRTLLRDRAGVALAAAKRQATTVAMLFLDLDQFKTINDSLGHAAGDEVLRRVAERLTEGLRGADTVGRLGGDEFLVVLPEGNERGATRVAQKILPALMAPIAVGGHQLGVSSSIGVAIFPKDGETFDELLRNADTAMYRAKNAGRNTYRFFAPEMNAAVLERLTLENALRQALPQRELTLHYQPQYDLLSEQLIGMEALVRWNHPRLGLVPPARFIPLAEDTGLIADIGAWVLLEACRQNRQWHDPAARSVAVAVNVSIRQFALCDLVAVVDRTLAATGLPAELLELEITESCVMQDEARVIAVLSALRARGVGVALDDFGTGHSSLACLRRLPITKLKLDRRFVLDLAHNAHDRLVAAAVIRLGQSLGISVLAEGVETVEQLDILRQLGADDVQGFLFSRPLPADTMTSILRARRSGLP